jgi:multicomponent Na+:H+ antiporter subunit C
MPYALCFLLFTIGLLCAVIKKNMVKIIIGLAIMEYAVNLFLIMLGFKSGGTAPIIERANVNPEGILDPAFIANCVDPLPQALVLTSIVIGLGTLALMVSLCVRTYEKYGTFDITEIRRLQG